ncbi:F-box/FBD/LRR-repeat protein At1g13570-like [Bidens hawaiensis]|uniref:F-box/FBD/LRR-repeat protein At1g13570-like n=1 Tax=Bidens hawaiensis TaxID=980011 RepID=UPI00404B105D
MSRLVIDYEFSRKFINYASYRHNGFIRTTNHIMINHKGPILKCVLHLPKNIDFDSFQEVDQWMVFLSRKNVKILNIKNSNHKIYRVPSSVFSCQGLRQLALRNCIFKAPVEFQGFPNLEHVFLMKVDFRGNLGGTVINLPQLKRLKLNSCVNVNNFNIKSENLRTLRVIRCPDAMLLRLLHSERLNEVRVCLQESIKNILGVERFSLAMMLSKLPKIRYFSVDGYFLKFLAARKFPKWLPNKVKCLKRLEFRRFRFCHLNQLKGALCMLRSSPNLKKLRVTHMQMGPEVDLELTFSYLDSPHCMPTLFKLQNVELTCVHGSRPEMLFIKLLLDHSPRLENMIIRPRATADAEKRHGIAKDIMMFPRASKKAKVVYLDS